MKFSIKDFSSKCDQIRRKLWIWLHLLEKSLMEKFSFCAVFVLAKQVKIPYLYFLKIPLETPNLLNFFCWFNGRLHFALEGYHSQAYQGCWGISLPTHLHIYFTLECLLRLDISFLSTEYLPSTGAPYCLISLIKVNSLAAKQLARIKVSKKHLIICDFIPIHSCWSRQVCFAKAAQYWSCLSCLFFFQWIVCMSCHTQAK